MLIREGIQRVIKQIEKVEKKAGRALKRKYHKCLGKTREWGENLKRYTQSFVKEVKTKVKEIKRVSHKTK
jgi:hypothetical protein